MVVVEVTGGLDGGDTGWYDEFGVGELVEWFQATLCIS